MRMLNLGILAHVDAGKTSLTERLLHATGVIDELGSVDDGNTQTDSLALERQRGITIKAAVVSFSIDDVTVNLIDTPGHPDFIAEVERVLNVLDGAVLVISAVEGVQAQTRVLMRTLERLRIPTLIFVNKIDRVGAQHDSVLQRIGEKLTPAVLAMGVSHDIGTRSAAFSPYGASDAEFIEMLADLLAGHDDALLAAWVDDQAAVSYRRLRAELAAQTKRAIVHPVFFGSAITGAGIDALMKGIATLLPASNGDVDAPVSGTVFKVERGAAGEKIAYVRVFSGALHTRDRIRLRGDKEHRVTAISVFDHGAAVPRASVDAGQIAKVWGLTDVQIGDAIGKSQTSAAHYFAPPTLETVIVPCRAADRGALHGALAQLAEQDPLINLRQDDVRRELFVSLYGEVQKEVIQATLASDFGIDVDFRETTMICIERPIGTGHAVEIMREAPNPFLATIGLRIDPGAIGSGVVFALEVELGSIRLAFHKALEDTVFETLRQGIYGWQVTDCIVTLTHSGYAPRQSHSHAMFDKSMSSTGSDFRKLTPLVLMAALKRAGTRVHQPMHRFVLHIPNDTLTPIFHLLAGLDAAPEPPTLQGASCSLEGTIPASRLHELQQRLPGLTRGEGELASAFERYEPVRGTTPLRARTDANPLNRKEYLLRVTRRSLLPGGRDRQVPTTDSR